MEQITTSATNAADTPPAFLNFIFKAYYHLTAYLPRPLPKNTEDLLRLKVTMTNSYGLKDSPEVWYTIASQISSTPSTKIRKSYGSMVNAAKRLDINKVAQGLKEHIIQEHEAKIIKITENIVNAPKPDEPEPAA